MSLLENYPQLKIIQDLAKKKKVSVFLVGGFVRDFLLDRDCLDFDFAVSKNSIALARLFAKEIRGAFILLDDEHGCARVAKKDGANTWTFDFADFRAPTFKDDLAHRDFTINTFSCGLKGLNGDADLADILVDMKNGKKDLKAGIIRMVSAKAFQEDPLRMLRAFSLRAVLDFSIEPKTLRQIKKDKGLIRDVSPERVRDELFKILESPRAGETLKAMDRIGLLDKIIPQVTVMYGIRQGTYHHLDVWPHSLETLVELEKLFCETAQNKDIVSYAEEFLAADRSRGALLKLAALLHDIGKPDTKKKEEGRTSFHGHERVGKIIVKAIAQGLKLSTRERFLLEDMVLWHLRPGYLSNFKTPSDRALFRYFRDTKDEAASIALLSLADQRATRGPLTTQKDQRHHEKICLNLINRYFEKKKEKPFIRLINGDDLIRTLHLKPSPVFAKILRKVDEEQATGKVQTKKEALTLAQKIAKSEPREDQKHRA